MQTFARYTFSFALAALLLAPLASEAKPKTDVVLHLLHHNDGESQLLDAGGGLEDFGGVDRFATQVKQLRREAFFGAGRGSAGRGRPFSRFYRRLFAPGRSATILVSAGDSILAGPEFNASLDNGVPFYDGIAYSLIGYDALTIGNHEFDLGPDVFADFVESFILTEPPFLAANLDFSGEPRLAALEAEGRLAPVKILRKRGRLFGVIGLTTPNLPFISAPRNVSVDDDLAGVVQEIVDVLERYRITRIILVSHLQGLQEDVELLAQLRGVDVVVAGGGDELLANEGDLLVPGDEDEVSGPYPLMAQDAEGKDVPIVTGVGNYKYVGRLIVGFDRRGEVVWIDDRSGPVRVAGGDNPDAVEPDLLVRQFVTEPVREAVDQLASTVVATTEVELDGRRNSVRSVETNEGNLIADAFLTKAAELSPSFGVATPAIAITNGGGIRNDSVIPVGGITELDTFNILPFGNFLAVVEEVTPAQLKLILENAVSRVVNVGGQPQRQGDGTGRFPQIAGFSFLYSLDAQPEEISDATDVDGDGILGESGERVLEVVIDGVAYVENGVVNAAAPNVAVATLSFLANGGDEFPFQLNGNPATLLGVTDQQTLSAYLSETLGGLVTAAQYPAGGEGRIVFTTNP